MFKDKTTPRTKSTVVRPNRFIRHIKKTPSASMSLNKGKAIQTTPPPPSEGTKEAPQEAHQDEPNPGPASGGRFFKQDNQQPSIWFTFCLDHYAEIRSQDWYAVLAVKCHDVPRLMREGFHFDASNVIREEGYMGNPETELVRADGKRYTGTRHYFLKDTQRPQRWIATIQVHAISNAILYRFQLSQLKRECINHALAEDQFGHIIYVYQLGAPWACFNAIYDDMVMEGLWPWPRNEREVTVKEEDGAPVDEKHDGGAEYKEYYIGGHDCSFQEGILPMRPR
jgi:hypothetical protein